MMEYREDSFYINKVIKGDASAYACLVEKYKSLAYTLALRIVRNPQDAEEIAQDAFVKAYNSLSKFKGDSKFSTWLYKIIYNTSVSKLRKKEIKTVSIDNRKHEGIYYSEQQDNFNTISLNDRVEILRLCFEKLSEEEKTILTLYYHDEGKVEEISKITGLSKSNVKVKLHRTRKKLYESLSILLKEEIIDMP